MRALNSTKCGILMLLVLAGSSCQLMHNIELSKIPIATAEHPVMEVVCRWEPAERTGLGGVPIRGFSGQIMFFALGESAPVRVDGKVRVSVYDDQGASAEPIQKFDFDSETFEEFLTKTHLGAAYQMFLPYTPKGEHQASCILRVRLIPEEGQRIYSKVGTVVLPGTIPDRADPALSQSTPQSVPTTEAKTEAEAATSQLTPEDSPSEETVKKESEQEKKEVQGEEEQKKEENQEPAPEAPPASENSVSSSQSSDSPPSDKAEEKKIVRSNLTEISRIAPATDASTELPHAAEPAIGDSAEPPQLSVTVQEPQPFPKD